MTMEFGHFSLWVESVADQKGGERREGAFTFFWCEKRGGTLRQGEGFGVLHQVTKKKRNDLLRNRRKGTALRDGKKLWELCWRTEKPTNEKREYCGSVERTVIERKKKRTGHFNKIFQRHSG